MGFSDFLQATTAEGAARGKRMQAKGRLDELPLFLFRGKQRDRAEDRMELVRGAGIRSETCFSHRIRIARTRSNGRTVDGWPEWWSNGKKEAGHGSGCKEE